MSQYDPLGLLAPLLVQAKLLLRNLYGKGREMAWDVPLPREQAVAWADLIKKAQHCPEISFPRSISPLSGVDPEIIAFWDGSLSAHGACLYMRWELGGGEGEARLITGKCRVAPLAGATVQRMELQGLTLCARLVVKVLEGLDMVVRGVTFVGDSLCCVMALRVDGVHFNPYFQHRLCDIQDNLDRIQEVVEVLHPVSWTESANNPADLVTKAMATAEDMAPGGI